VNEYVTGNTGCKHVVIGFEEKFADIGRYALT
jgi:hypothetical protein